VFLASVLQLEVLDAVSWTVDVEIDLEVDEMIAHIADRPRIHLYVPSSSLIRCVNSHYMIYT